MQVREFPVATRAQLAALALDYERGQLRETDYAAQELALIEAARTALGLDATWTTDPTGPQPHQPTGYHTVFWKP